jgi:hypothetical protein
MKNYITGALLFAVAFMPFFLSASAPAAIKDPEAKKNYATISKEVKRIFLDKNALLKTPLTKQETSAWNSVGNSVISYATKNDFFKELLGDPDSSERKEIPQKINDLYNEVLASLGRINEMYKKFPKDAKRLTVAEIPLLQKKNKKLEKIYSELMNYSIANVKKSKSQKMTDAALVLARYVAALQEICKVTVNLLQ